MMSNAGIGSRCANQVVSRTRGVSWAWLIIYDEYAMRRHATQYFIVFIKTLCIRHVDGSLGIIAISSLEACKQNWGKIIYPTWLGLLLLDEPRLWILFTISKIRLSCSTPTPPSVIQKPKSMRSHAHSSTHYSSIKMQFRFRHSKNKSERKYGRERRGKRIKSDPDVPILFRMHRRSHFMHRILKLHAVVFLAKLVLFMMIVCCSILCILFTW